MRIHWNDGTDSIGVLRSFLIDCEKPVPRINQASAAKLAVRVAISFLIVCTALTVIAILRNYHPTSLMVIFGCWVGGGFILGIIIRQLRYRYILNQIIWECRHKNILALPKNVIAVLEAALAKTRVPVHLLEEDWLTYSFFEDFEQLLRLARREKGQPLPDTAHYKAAHIAHKIEKKYLNLLR